MTEAQKQNWQEELCTLSIARGRGTFAVFRPARDDELAEAERKLDQEPRLLARPRTEIAAVIGRRQFYVLDGADNTWLGCGALWPIARKAIRPHPGVPCVELGALWVAEKLRGYGLQRVLGQIGIAEVVAADPTAEIYSGGVYLNPRSERNARWLGFADANAWAQRIWWPELCSFGKGCASRQRAANDGWRCCVRPMKLPDEWKRDAVRTFLSFVKDPPLITLTQENGDVLTIRLDGITALARCKELARFA
ncbi:MAG TPA: hypothetical protein VFA12_18715 [Stellaceae bacterium]|nr:hypothetical protein [Stellaceae bacterium]